jgi:SpoVK/Ycf46/Vps4 family AAA+-type ATPase
VEFGPNPQSWQVKMEDIGGLEEAKRALHEMLVLPTLEPSKYMAYGANPPRGLLLYGPPGTGKTLLAKAVAGEAVGDCITIQIQHHFPPEFAFNLTAISSCAHVSSRVTFVSHQTPFLPSALGLFSSFSLHFSTF